MLKNPAYKGAAAFGKTATGQMQPRLRPGRGHSPQPRRPYSTSPVAPQEWIEIPVPALVDEALFETVQQQLLENRQRARQSQRGAKYLLQGLVVCKLCGYSYYGKPVSHKAAQGKTRDYAYYRCIGTDAYRFGGQRLCSNSQVRTDLLEMAVWQEVKALLEQPQRLEQEYHRREQEPTSHRQQNLASLESQISKLRRGMGRLIDSYAEGLIDKGEFEPRMTRLKQRVAELEAQVKQVSEELALHTELRLIIGRLEEFATRVKNGLDQIDWPTQRELIRTLVKQVEIEQEQVHVVFQVEPPLRLQTLVKILCNIVSGVVSPLLANIALNGIEDIHQSVRSADDMVIILKPKDNAEFILGVINQFLAERGMNVSKQKTHITATTDGFDFFGWNFRVQKNGKFRCVPSVDNHKTFRQKVKAIVNNSNYGATVKAEKLAPIVRGWRNYPRYCKMDRSKNSLAHIETRAIRVFNKETKQSRKSSKKLLDQAFPSVPYSENKHINVKGAQSPFDGDITYWSERNSKPYNGTTSQALKRQDHTCGYCGLKLLSDERVHLHHIDGNHDNWQKSHLLAIHESCHDYIHMSKRKSSEHRELGAVKIARPDLNGRGGE